MKGSYPLTACVRRFFTERLLRQSQATPNTVATYRDTFRLLILYAAKRQGVDQRQLRVKHIDADLVRCFLKFCKDERGNSASSRNTRLSAIRSFFKYIREGSEPWLQEHCSEVLNISSQPLEERPANHLNSEELRALIAAPDCSSWLGRRDRTLLLLILSTGLRASQLTRLRRRDVELGTGAHVRWMGKDGMPQVRLLDRDSRQALQGWLSESKANPDDPVFMNRRGKALSQDALERLVRRHADRASEQCPTLVEKRVTPDMLRRAGAHSLTTHAKPSSLPVHEPADSAEVRADSRLETESGAEAVQGTIEGLQERQLSEEGPLEFLKAL